MFIGSESLGEILVADEVVSLVLELIGTLVLCESECGGGQHQHEKSNFLHVVLFYLAFGVREREAH